MQLLPANRRRHIACHAAAGERRDERVADKSLERFMHKLQRHGGQHLKLGLICQARRFDDVIESSQRESVPEAR